jgi:hypothetical protein
MGVDGNNILVILGPSKTLDIIENGGIILTDEEVDNDSNLICLKENYFNDKSKIIREEPRLKMNGKKTSNSLKISFYFRNIPPDDYLKLLLNKYKDCWFKNEYNTEDGDCGMWIGEIWNGGEKIQTMEWMEYNDAYYIDNEEYYEEN